MEKRLSKSLLEKNLYLVAVITIAAIILANQFVIQKLLSEQRADATVINLSGRQRMLSQRIVSLAYQAKEDPSKLYDLKAAVINWDNVHEALQNGDELYKLPGTENADIKTLFAQIEGYQDRIVEIAEAAETPEDLENNLAELVASAESFLPIMDDIVLHYQIESENKVQFLITVELILAALSLLVLILEIQFIFFPIIKEINRKNKKLEQLNLSKDRIMATVVHDLRNPITGIQGLTGLLEEELNDTLSEEQKMMFNLIEESCEKSHSMIQELLDIAVIESEDFHLEMEKTRVGEYLLSILSHFKMKAQEKGVDLQLEEKDKALLASIDQERFGRVIDNLISNALKFTDSDGEVTVETFKEGDRIVIKVEDTGIGIPQHMQGFIFDKFSKARRLGLKGEKTTGLGMSIVKQIVELHKGEIWLESEEDKGTKFYISLPKVS